MQHATWLWKTPTILEGYSEGSARLELLMLDTV
jgi:hypothetical protein